MSDRTPVANFSDGDFYTIPEVPLPLRQSVMAVVAYKGKEHHFLGTCFAISNHGLVLTARHVLEGIIRFSGANKFEEDNDLDGWWFAALYVGEDHPEQPRTRIGGPLPAIKAHFNPHLDIALLSLNVRTNRETGGMLQIPACCLSPGFPSTGDEIVGYGWHSMSWENATDGVHDFKADQRISATRGTVNQIHYPLRDRGSHDFPCFETSARFDAGMSGGPIFNDAGNVVGVICSTMGENDDGEHTSHGSLIGPAMLLEIDAITDDGSVEKRFLHDFVESGSVICDETANRIMVERNQSSGEISIDFGLSPRLQSKIDL